MSAFRSDWLRALQRLGVPVSPALRALLSIVGHTNPSLSQAGFRGRNDDGSQTAATWKAAENVNWTQAVDVNFRVRFVVDETAGGAENVQFKLQYNLNAAGWNDVNGTSLVVRSSPSTNFAEGDATTRQLTSGTGTFLAGKMDEVDGATNVNTSFAGGELTEHEFCCQVRSADVVNNDSLQLRLVRSTGTVLESYAQTPSITVSEGAPPAEFAAAVSGAASVAAALTTVIEMLASVLGTAAAAGALATAIQLAGSATGAASATASLTTEIPLAAAVTGAATVAADLTAPQQALFDAVVSGSASAVGGLTTAIDCVGAVTASAAAVGSLSTEIRFAGAAASLATVAGGLMTEIRLLGACAGAGTATGALSTAIALGGSVVASATMVGDLMAGAQAAEFQAAVLGSATVAAGLTTVVTFLGAVMAAALAMGELSFPLIPVQIYRGRRVVMYTDWPRKRDAH